jgi:hypothetical protein
MHEAFSFSTIVPQYPTPSQKTTARYLHVGTPLPGIIQYLLREKKGTALDIRFYLHSSVLAQEESFLLLIKYETAVGG